MTTTARAWATSVEAVTLEPRTMAHAEVLYAILAEPSLYRYIGTRAPASVADMRALLARSESRKSPDGTEHWLNWIVRTASGEVAGTVQSTIRPDGETFVAYILGRAFWGRGLARAAVARMIETVVADFDVRRLIAVIDRDNARSIALVTRLGFVPLATDEAARRRMADNDVVLGRSPT